MSGFSTDWLALREPADAAARSTRLTAALATRLLSRRPLAILDLGAGTGANLRHLAGPLGGDQHWLLVDHDAQLLADLPQRVSRWADAQALSMTHEAEVIDVRGPGLRCRLTTRRLDLRDAVNDPRLYQDRRLVTASALLDLVSETWFETLVAHCRASSAALLFALSYDGRIVCLPREPEDDQICALVNIHQRGDKGFGAAMGPDAVDLAASCLTRAGYVVERARSDWQLMPQAAALHRPLIAGWAEAAAAIAPEHQATIADWRARRLAHVAAGRSHLVVGHEDVAAWLTK